MNEKVCIHVTFIRKCLLTYFTSERFLISKDEVFSQVTLARNFFLASQLKGFSLLSVRRCAFKLLFIENFFVAYRTTEKFLVSMDTKAFFQVTLSRYFVVAYLTTKRFVICMKHKMVFKNTLERKFYATYLSTEVFLIYI